MNAADTAAALAARAEAVCARFLPLGRKVGRYWTAGDVHGAHGRSLFVRLAPPGTPGKWTDAAEGTHGDLLDLVRLSTGAASLREALAEAHRFLAQPVPPAVSNDVPYDRTRAARNLWQRCRPIEATHAEAYLRARAIHRCRFPALRFHASLAYRDDAGRWRRFPALVAAVTGNDGCLDLRGQIDDARHANRRAVGRLFADLAPRLTAARRREQEQDPQQAHRFNVLDYLKTDELGLSRIIADLLDPQATHGQDLFFLRKLLLALKEFTQFDPGDDLERCQVSVERERITTANRKIDIVVEIVDGRSRYALTIENKPYADDGEHQVRDYLRFLRGEYARDFLLIYLSPTGEGPSDWSISRKQLHANWTGRFAILPYHRGPGAWIEDAFEAFRVPCSLTDWLDACQAECKVDRLRWFLGDILQFWRRTFGSGRLLPATHHRCSHLT